MGISKRWEERFRRVWGCVTDCLGRHWRRARTLGVVFDQLLPEWKCIHHTLFIFQAADAAEWAGCLWKRHRSFEVVNAHCQSCSNYRPAVAVFVCVPVYSCQLATLFPLDVQIRITLGNDNLTRSYLTLWTDFRFAHPQSRNVRTARDILRIRLKDGKGRIPAQLAGPVCIEDIRVRGCCIHQFSSCVSISQVTTFADSFLCVTNLTAHYWHW